jgi:AraC-like DNA-binding protein
MYEYTKITIDDVWQDPMDENRKLKPSGCHFLDTLSHRVLHEKHAASATWAKRMGVTPMEMYATVRTITNMIATDWINTLTLRLIMYWLMHTPWPISEIAHKAGFTSSNAMLKFFQMMTKQTPRQFRDNHQEIITEVTRTIVVHPIQGIPT